MKKWNPFRRKPRPVGVDTEIWRLVAISPRVCGKNSLLTPNDIRDQVFSTHRFREGYDMDEVDAYLDHIRDTISRLAKTLETLQKDKK